MMIERMLGSTLGICSKRVRPSIRGMLMSVTTMSIPESSFNISRASTPFWAKTSSYRPARMSRRIRCMNRG